MKKDEADILRLVWGKGVAGEVLQTASGEAAAITNCGEPKPDGSGVFTFAEVDIAGRTLCGDVIFGDVPLDMVPYSAVLHVVSGGGTDTVMRPDGVRVAQVVFPVPERVHEAVENLRRGAATQECAAWLAGVAPLTRISLYENLFMERLERKCSDVMRALEAAGGDWSQTFHAMLFRAMGGNSNREAYMRLASTATHNMVLRERSSVTIVEALLLGSSGLLEGCYYDDYIHTLRDHFKYLSNKYGIRPMHADHWSSRGSFPCSIPIQRIVQLAAFLSEQNFVLDRLLACRTREDVHALFSAEASHYWKNHYIPDGSRKKCPARIGEEKADLLGINLVVPMMFAYGIFSGKEELREASLALQMSIPAETNSLLRGWTGKGAHIATAADSQAVLQLNNEYCLRARCTECRVGRRLINR